MLIKKGSTGDDVKKIQGKLNLPQTGVFDQKLEDAVKLWQSKNGLTSDGIMGNISWGKMMQENLNADIDITAPVKSTHIDINTLSKVIPKKVLDQIPGVMEKFSINTPLRLAHFLSQCGHESGGFTLTEENLNYSADGLKRVFPKYFPGNLNESYARKPEKIGSRVYGSRMGNGSEETKEGYKYRGRGYIQLTGKSNYESFGKDIGVDLKTSPDLVATQYPLLSAGWFFHKNKINEISDKGSSDDVVIKVTKRVNGGTIGIADRLKHFKEYYALLKPKTI